jgi:tetratricopeptide (TPR) repeat protein
LVTLGQKIRSARIEERLTQEQLAGADLSKSYISEVERGRRTPRLITLKVLARRLHRPLSYFLDGAAEDREAEVHLQLGMAHLEADSVRSALTSLEKALELAVQQADEALQARIELALARADQKLGSPQRAQRRLDRSLRVLIRTADAPSMAAAHCCLGLIKLDCGDPGAALWSFQAGLQFTESVSGDPGLRSRLHCGIGLAHRKLGNAHEAREAFGLALEVADSVRDHHRVASRHLELAESAAGAGRFEQALEHAWKGLAVAEALSHTRRLAEIHGLLGELDSMEGRWETAEHHFRWSVVLHGAAANLPLAAGMLSRVAEVLVERASPDAARAMCEAAVGLLNGESDRDERAHVLRVMGTICRIAGRREEAEAALQESLTLFGRLNPRDQRLIHQELALLALEAGDLEEARKHLETLQQVDNKNWGVSAIL